MEDNKIELRELSQQLLTARFNQVEPEQEIRGRTGHKWNFDFLVHYNNKKFGIVIRDWKRSIGVNQIRQLQKAIKDTDCMGGIIVGEEFSPNAEMYASNFGIQILTRYEITRKLRGF